MGRVAPREKGTAGCRGPRGTGRDDLIRCSAWNAAVGEGAGCLVHLPSGPSRPPLPALHAGLAKGPDVPGHRPLPVPSLPFPGQEGA